MKKKAGIIKSTWMLKTVVKTDEKVVATLTPGELAAFLQSQSEVAGLSHALGTVERLRKLLWAQAGIKYGFDGTVANGHSINLITGEITKLF